MRAGSTTPEGDVGPGAGRPVRVLLVEPDLHDNGAIRVSLDRAVRWQRAGASVTVLVLTRVPVAAAALPAGLPVVFGTRVPRSKRWSALLSLGRGVREALRADVVVAGREVDKGLLLAAVVAPLTRRPLAVTVQSNPDVALEEYTSPRVRPLVRRALTSAQLGVAVAAGILPGLERLGLPRQRARTVTNGVDVPAIRAAAAQPSPLPPAAGPVVVASGRLARQKGFDLLVRAHARALADGAPAHTLVVLGDGPDEADLRRLADELGVGASVVLAGFQANPHAVVGRADLFVLPSRWEGYPLGLVEALCLGTPVIAADCVSGPDEVLDGGRYGELVPPDDVGALAAALVRHLRDPSALRLRAQAGADAAAVRFDPQRAADRHLALLEQLVRTGRRGTLPAPLDPTGQDPAT